MRTPHFCFKISVPIIIQSLTKLLVQVLFRWNNLKSCCWMLAWTLMYRQNYMSKFHDHTKCCRWTTIYFSSKFVLNLHFCLHKPFLLTFTSIFLWADFNKKSECTLNRKTFYLQSDNCHLNCNELLHAITNW